MPSPLLSIFVPHQLADISWWSLYTHRTLQVELEYSNFGVGYLKVMQPQIKQYKGVYLENGHHIYHISSRKTWLQWPKHRLFRYVPIVSKPVETCIEESPRWNACSENEHHCYWSELQTQNQQSLEFVHPSICWQALCLCECSLYIDLEEIPFWLISLRPLTTSFIILIDSASSKRPLRLMRLLRSPESQNSVIRYVLFWV